MPTTFEKTWQMDMNRQAEDVTTVLRVSASILLYLKKFITGALGFKDGSGNAVGSPSGLWTVYSSNDGAGGFGNGDSVDHWATVANVIRANAGTNHSWMVLKSGTSFGGLGYPIYLIMDVSGGSDSSPVVMSLSKSAPTGGTATAAPTASDQTGLSSSNMAMNDNTTSATRCNGAMATDGNFVMYTGKNGGAVPYFGALVMSTVAAEVPVADAAAFFGLFAGSTAAPGGFKDSFLMGLNVRSRNGSNNANPSTPCIWVPAGTTTPFTVCQISAPGTDGTDGLYFDFPVYWGQASSTAGSIRGRVADLFLAPQNAPAGTVDPTAGNPVAAIIGCFWVPVYTTPLF